MLNGFAPDVIKLYLLRGIISVSIEAFLSEDDVKDGVWATACLIHVGGSHSPAQTDSEYIFCQFVQQGGCVFYNNKVNKFRQTQSRWRIWGASNRYNNHVIWYVSDVFMVFNSGRNTYKLLSDAE